MFFHKYLHDFVRLVHKCENRERDIQNKEYEVIYNCGGVVGTSNFCLGELSCTSMQIQIHLCSSCWELQIV